MDVGNLMNGLGGGLGTIANWGTQLVDSGKSQVNTVGMNYNNAGLNNISDLSNFQANTFDTGDIVAPNKAAQAGNVFISMGEGALAGSSINVPWGTIAGAAAGLAKGTAQAFIQNDTYHNDIARANRFNNNSRKTAVKLAGQASNNIVNNSYNSMRFNNEFAEGGDLSYGMPNIDIINSGGTHEGNPNMGVAYGVDNQGTPNKVEEGEVVVELSSGEKVVISDRVISSREDGLKNNVPSFDGKISCAQMAKKIIESFKDRKDPYSKKTMNALLERIYNTQEYTKIRQEAESQGMTAEEYIQMQQEQEAYAQQQMLAQQQAQQAQGQDQMQDQGYDEDMMYSNGSDQQAAMIQQLAQEYGVSPEEIMQMMAQQQGGEVPQEEIPQENMNAYGGNLYATGGRKKKFGYSHYKKAFPWIDREGYKALRDGLFVGESGGGYFYGSNLDGYINDIHNKVLSLEDPESLSLETRAQLIDELYTPRLIDSEDPESNIIGGLLPIFPNPIEDEAIKLNYLDKSRREFKKEINNPVYGYTKIARKNLLDYYDKNNPSVLAEALNTASSTAGFIPGYGDAFDIANAVVQATRGNWVDAGLSSLSAVPFAGSFGNLAKLFKSGQKLRRAKAYIDGAYTYAKTGKVDLQHLNKTYGLTGRHKLRENALEIIRDEKKLAKKINVDGLPHKTEVYLQELKDIKPDKNVTTTFKTTDINGEPVTIIKNGNDNSIEVREKDATIIFTKSENKRDYKVQQKSLNDSGTEDVTTITDTKADEYKKAYETYLSSIYSDSPPVTLTDDGRIIRVPTSNNSLITESTPTNAKPTTESTGAKSANGTVESTPTGSTKSTEPTTKPEYGLDENDRVFRVNKPTTKPKYGVDKNGRVFRVKPTTKPKYGVDKNGRVFRVKPTTKPEYGVDKNGRVFRVNKPTTNPTESAKPVTTEPTTSKPTTESTGAKSTETPKPTESTTAKPVESANNNAANTNAAESTPTNAKPTTESTGAKSADGTVESTPTNPTESTTAKPGEPSNNNAANTNAAESTPTSAKPTTESTTTTDRSVSVDTDDDISIDDDSTASGVRNQRSRFSKFMSPVTGFLTPITTIRRNNKAYKSAIRMEKAAAKAQNRSVDSQNIKDFYLDVMRDEYPRTPISTKSKWGINIDSSIPDYSMNWSRYFLGPHAGILSASYLLGAANLGRYGYNTVIAPNTRDARAERRNQLEQENAMTVDSYISALPDLAQEGMGLSFEQVFEIAHKNPQFSTDGYGGQYARDAKFIWDYIPEDFKSDTVPTDEFYNWYNSNYNNNEESSDTQYAMGGSLSNSLPEYDQYLLRRSRINSDPNLFAFGGGYPIEPPTDTSNDVYIKKGKFNFSDEEPEMYYGNHGLIDFNQYDDFDSVDKLKTTANQNQASPTLLDSQSLTTRDQRKAARRERWANQKDGFQKATNMFAQTNPLQYASLFDSIGKRLFPESPDYTYSNQLSSMYNPLPYQPNTQAYMRKPESSVYHQLGMNNNLYASNLNNTNNYSYNNNLGRALSIANASKQQTSLNELLSKNYLQELNNSNQFMSNRNTINTANMERVANRHQWNTQNMLATKGLGYQQADAERTALREAQNASRQATVKDLSTLGNNMRIMANINNNPNLLYSIYNNYKNATPQEQDKIAQALGTTTENLNTALLGILNKPE